MQYIHSRNDPAECVCRAQNDWILIAYEKFYIGPIIESEMIMAAFGQKQQIKFLYTFERLN